MQLTVRDRLPHKTLDKLKPHYTDLLEICCRLVYQDLYLGVASPHVDEVDH
jgi:hypothetical protein